MAVKRQKRQAYAVPEDEEGGSSMHAETSPCLHESYMHQDFSAAIATSPTAVTSQTKNYHDAGPPIFKASLGGGVSLKGPGKRWCHSCGSVHHHKSKCAEDRGLYLLSAAQSAPALSSLAVLGDCSGTGSGAGNEKLGLAIASANTNGGRAADQSNVGARDTQVGTNAHFASADASASTTCVENRQRPVDAPKNYGYCTKCNRVHHWKTKCETHANRDPSAARKVSTVRTKVQYGTKSFIGVGFGRGRGGGKLRGMGGRARAPPHFGNLSNGRNPDHFAESARMTNIHTHTGKTNNMPRSSLVTLAHGEPVDGDDEDMHLQGTSVSGNTAMSSGYVGGMGGGSSMSAIESVRAESERAIASIEERCALFCAQVAKKARKEIQAIREVAITRMADMTST